VTWWLWTLVWVLLVAGALVVLLLTGRTVWRRGLELLDELGTASERFEAVAALARERAGVAPAPEPEPSVFADPAALRQERVRRRRR
jgi:hypothetical protein